MKGLEQIPQVSDIERAYQNLKTTQSVITIANLALWSQWTRLDPRLGELWIGWVGWKWEETSPLELSSELKKQPWPAAMWVLLEHIPLLIPSAQKGVIQKYRAWMNLVMSAGVATIEPAPPGTLKSSSWASFQPSKYP